MRYRRLLLAGWAIGLGLLATPSLAQNADSAGQMQDVIEQQQTQIEAQQKQLEAQQKQLENLQRSHEEQLELLRTLQSQIQSTAAEPARVDPLIAAEDPLTQAPIDPELDLPEIRAPVSQMDRHDVESPTGSAVTYFGPAAEGMIPGKETSWAVHGLIEFQMFHDTVGINNNRFDTATIPVDGGPSQTKYSVNPSQLAVSSSTPIDNGQLSTWFSIDMNGELTSPEPRLRIAFGEYVDHSLGLGILVGQTYSTMLDLRAVPETLDFALPAGLWQLRQPLLRVTKAYGDSFIAVFSTETPENVTYTGADARTEWPDFVAAGTWLTGGNYFSHLRLAALVRDLNAAGPDGSTDSATGWAVSGSTKIWLPFMGERDNLKITAHFGEGYGLAVKGGHAEGIWDAENSSLETIGLFAVYGGLQHFWSEHWRSNLAFGYVENDNPSIATDDTLKSTTYLAADIIWSPFATTRFGFEWLWGEREDENGESGTSNRFLLSSRFQF
jgi:hypothetical protein